MERVSWMVQLDFRSVARIGLRRTVSALGVRLGIVTQRSASPETRLLTTVCLSDSSSVPLLVVSRAVTELIPSMALAPIIFSRERPKSADFSRLPVALHRPQALLEIAVLDQMAEAPTTVTRRVVEATCVTP